jgi:polar amino acid transport system substrate-binding protein
MRKISSFLLLIFVLALFGCKESEQKESNELHFATAAEYPPFEYSEHGILKGFDIDLARMVAKELGKKAVFDNMQFSTVLPSLTSGQADAAISTITITETRKKNFDFSDPYYFDGMVAIFRKTTAINKSSQLSGKKLSAQLGSVMELWLRSHFPNDEITTMDNNNQAIEALSAGHVDVVVMDASQGPVFCQKHTDLTYTYLTQAQDGYGIALKRDSPLTAQINKALNKLIANGSIEQLEKTWLGNTKKGVKNGFSYLE